MFKVYGCRRPPLRWKRHQGLPDLRFQIGMQCYTQRTTNLRGFRHGPFEQGFKIRSGAHITNGTPPRRRDPGQR